MLFWKNDSPYEKYVLQIDNAMHIAHFTRKLAPPWPAWAIGPFVRFAGNPLLTPKGDDWEARNAENPGMLFDESIFRMLYRGQAKKMKSQIGYTESEDGVTFKRNDPPIIPATEPFGSTYGCEDARLYKLGDTYYALYTGNVPDTNSIALCEATSKDAHSWTKLGVIEPNTKNGALLCDAHNVPVQVNGRYVMYLGNNSSGVCYSDDLTHWDEITQIDLGLATG